jgi:hypothetical protein
MALVTGAARAAGTKKMAHPGVRHFSARGNQPAHWTMFSLIACGGGESDTCLCDAENRLALAVLKPLSRAPTAGRPRVGL